MDWELVERGIGTIDPHTGETKVIPSLKNNPALVEKLRQGTAEADIL